MSLSGSGTEEGIRGHSGPCPPGPALGLLLARPWAGRAGSVTPTGLFLCPFQRRTLHPAMGPGTPSLEAPWCFLPAWGDPRGRGPVASLHPPPAALPGPEVVEARAALAAVPSGHMRQAGALAGPWVTGSLLAD